MTDNVCPGFRISLWIPIGMKFWISISSITRSKKEHMNFSIEQPTIQSYHLWNLNLTTLDLSPLLDVSNVA